ncbi:hypothetical protein ACFW6V_28345 [Streptomyces sp. NPDC058734]|uniref:cyanobactin maturation protease PatG family protein n=1 Tax=Streptomyces sp. NPDC058734 TaxID=3346615 RepID=UPI0036A29BA3
MGKARQETEVREQQPHDMDAQDTPAAACGVPEPAPDLEPVPPAQTTASFVYAIGRVEPRFPSLAVEKEVAQVIGREQTAGLTDRQALRSVLTDRSNRYLARQMCWLFTVEGLETYILLPRDPTDVDLLIDALRPEPSVDDVDIVIGVRGPIAPPEACNSLLVPMVIFDQLYSFTCEDLIRELPRPDGQTPEGFRATAEEVFNQIRQVCDNAGSMDEHRALNYLVVRYPAIYARAVEAHAEESALSGVEVRPSPLSGTRSVMDVIFSYVNRRTDFAEKYFVRVDVSEEFPFLVSKLATFYDR